MSRIKTLPKEKMPRNHKKGKWIEKENYNELKYILCSYEKEDGRRRKIESVYYNGSN